MLTALARYQEAALAAPGDLAPVLPMVDLLVRLRQVDQAAAVLSKMADQTSETGSQFEALMALGDLYSNIRPDALKAIETYQEALALRPDASEPAGRKASLKNISFPTV